MKNLISALAIMVFVSCAQMQKPEVKISELTDLIPLISIDQIKRIKPIKYTNECLIGIDTDYDGKIDLIGRYQASDTSFEEDYRLMLIDYDEDKSH